MNRCPSITRGGEPCKGVVRPGETYCVAHDPNRVGERKRSASRAAKSKPNAELRAAKQELRELIDGVRAKSIDRGDAAVCGQLLGTLLRAIKLSVELQEIQEICQRLDALEASQKNQTAQPWKGVR